MLMGILVLETSKGKGDKENVMGRDQYLLDSGRQDSRSLPFPSAVFAAVFILPDVQEFEC